LKKKAILTSTAKGRVGKEVIKECVWSKEVKRRKGNVLNGPKYAPANEKVCIKNERTMEKKRGF